MKKEEWKEYKLGDLCSKIGSGATPSGGKEAYKGGDFNLVRSQNVLDFSFSFDGLAKINDEQAQKLNNVELQENDVLINITGDSVARACIVPQLVLPGRVNQHVAIMRAKADVLDYRYLLYFLQHQKKQLLTLASGGATRNALTKQMLEDYPIRLPALATQQRIAKILSTLDDKIELNNAINRNLEEQAQAIFKSWFIDFESFGGEMPADWKTIQAQEYFSISIGKTPPRKEQELFSDVKTDDNVKWVSISDMGSCGMYISDSSEYLTKEAITNYNVCIIPDNTVILSFKLTVGRIAITDGEMTSNEAIAHFCSEDKTINEYLYCYLKNFSFETMGSTSSIATAVNSKIIKAMPFILPNKETIDRFHKITKPLFDTIKSNQQETKKLMSIRDGLLPKLMSGEMELGR